MKYVHTFESFLKINEESYLDVNDKEIEESQEERGYTSRGRIQTPAQALGRRVPRSAAMQDLERYKVDQEIYRILNRGLATSEEDMEARIKKHLAAVKYPVAQLPGRVAEMIQYAIDKYIERKR